MIRRLKSLVLTDLPPKRRTAVMTDVNDQGVTSLCKKLNTLRTVLQRVLLKKRENLSAALPDEEECEVDNGEVHATATAAHGSRVPTDDNDSSDSSDVDGPAVAAGIKKEEKKSTAKSMLDLYMKTGQVKVNAVLEYISVLLQRDSQKILVFAHHRVVLDSIQSYLDKCQVGYMRIDGSTSAEDRQASVETFQTNPACRMAVLSLTAAGTGLTLTAGSIVVFAELYWTPALLLQAEDRVHRIGQTRDVNIFYIIGNNTLDDLMWPLITEKLEVVGSALNGSVSKMDFSSVTGTSAIMNQNEQLFLNN